MEVTLNSLTEVRALCVVFHFGIILVLAAVSSAPTCAAPGPALCPTLASLTLPNTTITQTRSIGAGEFALTPDEHSQDSVKSWIQGRARLLPRGGHFEAHER